MPGSFRLNSGVCSPVDLPLLPKRNHPEGMALVLAAHSEGAYLAAAVRCAVEALRALQVQAVPVELVLVLHGADGATGEAAAQLRRRCAVPLRLLKRHRHGQAQAWQAGIRHTRQAWIALGTVDDLLAPNWLNAVTTAIGAQAEGSARCSVFHPRALFCFENEQQLQLLPDQGELDHPLAALLSQELWPGSCVAHRSVFRVCPLQPVASTLPPALGNVLWNWHCRSLQAGFVHQALDGTCQFRRQRAAVG